MEGDELFVEQRTDGLRQSIIIGAKVPITFV
jgi:hypothetical protein